LLRAFQTRRPGSGFQVMFPVRSDVKELTPDGGKGFVKTIQRIEFGEGAQIHGTFGDALYVIRHLVRLKAIEYRIGRSVQRVLQMKSQTVINGHDPSGLLHIHVATPPTPDRRRTNTPRIPEVSDPGHIERSTQMCRKTMCRRGRGSCKYDIKGLSLEQFPGELQCRAKPEKRQFPVLEASETIRTWIC
jgi:hypothetical protein